MYPKYKISLTFLGSHVPWDLLWKFCCCCCCCIAAAASAAAVGSAVHSETSNGNNDPKRLLSHFLYTISKFISVLGFLDEIT